MLIWASTCGLVILGTIKDSVMFGTLDPILYFWRKNHCKLALDCILTSLFPLFSSPQPPPPHSYSFSRKSQVWVFPDVISGSRRLSPGISLFGGRMGCVRADEFPLGQAFSFCKRTLHGLCRNISRALRRVGWLYCILVGLLSWGSQGFC